MRRSIDSRDGGMGSEDFCIPIPTNFPVPICFSAPGLHRRDSRYGKPMHNPQVIFNEDILPRRSTAYTDRAAVSGAGLRLNSAKGSLPAAPSPFRQNKKHHPKMML